MGDEDKLSTPGSRIGTVEAIHITPETSGEPDSQQSVEAVAKRGIKGDRYYNGEGLYSISEELEPHAITLIEAEALEAAEKDYDVDFGPGEHRRNITTRGVALNHLVGERFRVGDAVIEGGRLCEPCGYMQSLSEQPDAGTALKHRGGLDAHIVESGEISVDDDIVW